jgi:hypothetical protein
MGLKNEYHGLVSVANNALLPFGSTYLREAFSSAMTAIKTRYQNKLNLCKNQTLEITVSQSVKPRL